jgi:hypothetical protein
MDDHNLNVLQMKAELDQTLQDSEPEPSHTKSTILMMILSTMVQHYEPPVIEPFPNHNSEHKTDPNMAHVRWIHKQLANAHQP